MSPALIGRIQNYLTISDNMAWQLAGLHCLVQILPLVSTDVVHEK